MTRPTLILILTLCGLSAALGWWRADPSAASKGAVVDGWDAMQHQPLPDSAYAEIARQVKASALLPISRMAERRGEVTGAATDTAATPTAGKFPKVLSRGVIDRIPYIVLQGSEMMKTLWTILMTIIRRPQNPPRVIRWRRTL